MKKTAAILLLLIFWFNLSGYQFLLNILEEKADQKLELLIDNNEYAEEELLELRVPLHMPYQQRYTAFERFHGRITIGGHTYEYVKRKIEGDVLILKCIPNQSKDRLNNLAAIIAHSNTNNDPSPAKSTVKIFSFNCELAVDPEIQRHVILKKQYTFSHLASWSDCYLAAPDTPPRYIS